MSNTNKPLKTLLQNATPPYTSLATHLLFTTIIHAVRKKNNNDGTTTSTTSHYYRLREIEFYSSDDPYTHCGDEQISTCGGWYFHRTKLGGGWKGGTFVGLDISFAPVGVAGGVLIRGLERCRKDGSSSTTTTTATTTTGGGGGGGTKGSGRSSSSGYIDGSCNCARELLAACGFRNVKDLVADDGFDWDALSDGGVLRLVELEEPVGVVTNNGTTTTTTMEWRATSRVGLSDPAKKPDRLEERKRFHLTPFRFLSAPYVTKKEKTKVNNALTVGVYSKKDYFNLLDSLGSGGEKKDESSETIVDNDAESALLFDSDSDDDSNTEDTNKDLKRLKKIKPHAKKKTAEDTTATWQYWLDKGMDGLIRGWHNYDPKACTTLEGFLQNKGTQISRTTWHLKSGYFSYEVNVNQMTQRNMTSGTVRPIRRMITQCSISNDDPPPMVIKNITTMTKKHKASSYFPSSTLSSSTHTTKKLKITPPPTTTTHTADLNLSPLFTGPHSHFYKQTITSILSTLPQSPLFISPNRSPSILPLREMTFRSLMALPPQDNNIIIFGQAPYPRVESASGIAMFDSLISSWEDSQFGKTSSMRNIAKTAAVAMGMVDQNASIGTLRRVFGERNVVSPPEWFQAMLSQGVLLLNASLTTGGSMSPAKHTSFWIPVMEGIIETIIKRKMAVYPTRDSPRRRLTFLWWGNEALKTKKKLTLLLERYERDVDIVHVTHYNPAAQGDLFSRTTPNHFRMVNEALKEARLDEINWMPDKLWMKDNCLDKSHELFITETRELHKFYLERLTMGLDNDGNDNNLLPPIVGIMTRSLESLPDACRSIGLRSEAFMALDAVDGCSCNDDDDDDDDYGGRIMTRDEKGSLYLYSTNALYRRLNEALRHPQRVSVGVYYAYLRLFLEAYTKMASSSSSQSNNEDDNNDDDNPPSQQHKPRLLLYRGINKNLAKQYHPGSTVTWWSISSCTPDINVAKSFGGGSSSGTLFHVSSTTAVGIGDYSAYKDEEEYVLAPGTVLKVTNVVVVEDDGSGGDGVATQIYLEEMEGERRVM